MSKKPEDVPEAVWDKAFAEMDCHCSEAMMGDEELEQSVHTAVARAIMAATAAKPDRCAALLREADKLIIWENTPLPSDFQERVERALS